MSGSAAVFHGRDVLCAVSPFMISHKAQPGNAKRNPLTFTAVTPAKAPRRKCLWGAGVQCGACLDSGLRRNDALNIVDNQVAI